MKKTNMNKAYYIEQEENESKEVKTLSVVHQ